MYDYSNPELSEDYLEHHGIDGQKWYHRNGPPYPLSRDISTGSRLKKGAAGKISKKKAPKGILEKHRAKKVHKQRVQAAEKARQAKQQKAQEAKARQEAQDREEREALERETWRQNVIRTGDAEAAKDHTDLFSTDEINAIISKYKADQSLKQLVEDANKVSEQPVPQTQQQQTQSSAPKKDERTRMEKIGDAITQIQKVTGPVSQVAKDAQNIYTAYNAIFGEKKKPTATNNKTQSIKNAANAVNNIAGAASKGAEEFNKVNEIRKNNLEKQKGRGPVNQEKKPVQNIQNTQQNNAQPQNSTANQKAPAPPKHTYVKKPGENRDLVERVKNTTHAKTDEEAREYINKFLTPRKSQNIANTSYYSVKNSKASDNLKKLQSENAKNQKMVEDVSRNVDNTTRRMLDNSYLSSQSTDALQTMKYNLREDMKDSKGSYKSQQKATLQDIEKILKERKRK